MADDAGAYRALPEIEIPPSQHRRGPLRPERMQTVRTRVSGAGLARLFQAGDAAALAVASIVATRLMTLPEAMWLGAPAIAIFLLVATGAYAMSARERTRRRFGRPLDGALRWRR